VAQGYTFLASHTQALDEFGLPRFFESDRIQVAALIVAEYSSEHSHWNSTGSLGDWLTVRLFWLSIVL
jgi:carbamoylphosphate synthase small subunit